MHVGNFEALAHERVANLLNALLISASSAEYNQVGDFFLTILNEGLEVSKGLSAGDSEEHFFHALHFVVLDGTSDELQGAIHHRLIRRVFSVTASLSGAGTFKVVGHLVNEADDLVVILKLIDIALDLLNSFPLRNHEAFALAHILLDCIKKKVVTLLLLVLDR